MTGTLSVRLAAYCVFAGFAASYSPAASEPEDELKAAIVLSFLRYTEWPPTPGDTPITVGVLLRPQFAQLLRQALEGKLVGSRHIRVVELQTPKDSQSCQVIYFASDKNLEIRQALQASPAHALTIGEGKDFIEAGGAVNLLVVDGRMSFEVSLEALERNGISISSKLLRFGQIRGRAKGSHS